VVLTTGCNRWDGGLDLVVEGEAVQVTDDAVLGRVAGAFAAKWDGRWQFTARGGCFRSLAPRPQRLRLAQDTTRHGPQDYARAPTQAPRDPTADHVPLSRVNPLTNRLTEGVIAASGRRARLALVGCRRLPAGGHPGRLRHVLSDLRGVKSRPNGRALLAGAPAT